MVLDNQSVAVPLFPIDLIADREEIICLTLETTSTVDLPGSKDCDRRFFSICN